MELTDTGAVSPSGQLPFRSANGSWVLPFDGRPTFLAVKSQDCQFAAGSHGRADVQVSLMHAFILLNAVAVALTVLFFLRAFRHCCRCWMCTHS